MQSTDWSQMDKHTNSFEERNFETSVDLADLRFRERLDAQGVKYRKIGPDAKEDFLDDFWIISPILLLPDYIVWAKTGIILFAEVKGTNKIKVSDYNKLEQMHKKATSVNEHSKKKVEVGIAYIKYPKTNKAVKWVPFDTVKDLWKQVEHQTYKDEYELDGSPKMYKSLQM